MQKIGLYNLEPQFKNLALEKIRLYYKKRGDEVRDCTPIDARNYDTVYCSSIFDWTNKKYVFPEMMRGGTGFDLTTKLPPEIDAVEPHINRGFTVRGCCNNCSFCVVPRKEGGIKITGDTLTLWDGHSKLVVYYDNNVLAVPEHFEHNAIQAMEHKITQDYNQGLDHRKLIPEIVDIMTKVSHKEYHFAFDNIKSADTVEKAITLLQSKGINRCSWYVLCGYDTTFEDDLWRLNYLRERGQNAYVQRFRRNGECADYLIPLARWANQHHIFQGMTWEQFINRSENKIYKKELKNTLEQKEQVPIFGLSTCGGTEILGYEDAEVKV